MGVFIRGEKERQVGCIPCIHRETAQEATQEAAQEGDRKEAPGNGDGDLPEAQEEALGTRDEGRPEAQVEGQEVVQEGLEDVQVVRPERWFRMIV